jgi:hypothetical protein
MLSSIVLAQQGPSPAINVTLQFELDGPVSFVDARAGLAYLTESMDDGTYAIELLDEQHNLLWGVYYAPTFAPMTDPPQDLNEEELEQFMLETMRISIETISLPLNRNARYLLVKKAENNEKLLLVDMRDILCNKDGNCNNNENVLSCPEDCSAEQPDNYCLALIDNVCDPDCVAGVDPDCNAPKLTGAVPLPQSQPDKEKPFKLPLSHLYLILVLLLIAALTVAYMVARRINKYKR